MRPLWPDSPNRCLPLRVVASAPPGGGLLGGEPPSGVMPARSGLRFFLTVPFCSEPALHLSIFVADLGVLLAYQDTICLPGAVEVITHPPRPRGAGSPHRSELAALSLSVGDEIEDLERDENGTVFPYLGHKLGGRAFLIRQGALAEAIVASAREGFRHVLQMVFPGPPDVPVSGTWPFGDGVFHLFARPPCSLEQWRWCWQH